MTRKKFYIKVGTAEMLLHVLDQLERHYRGEDVVLPVELIAQAKRALLAEAATAGLLQC